MPRPLSPLGLGLCCALILSVCSSAVAETKVGRWSEKGARTWWAKHAAPESWLAERDSIHAQLLTIHQKMGTTKALTNAHFAGWLKHRHYLSLFPKDWESHEFYQEATARATFLQLAHQTSLRELFLTSLSPYDDSEKALEVLCRIYRASPKATLTYPALAVAISLVFDQPFPEGWPHHFVSPEQVPRVSEKPEDRFAFFANSQERRALFFDLQRLSVSDLKFVVDTPVSIKELEYVQQVKLRDVKQFHNLFQMIKYDRPRLQRRDYLWPHGRYQLPTIAKQGGLCVDQAYYTSHAAKAKGVPNIVFLGQGNSGEHAWMGYLERPGRWRFDLAKFRNEDYPVGQAFDPQTWRRLTDSECEFLNRRGSSSEAFAKARLALTWAQLNPGEEFHLPALKIARRFAPEYLWAWEMEARALTETGASVENRTRFWNDWISAFANQQDLRFRGEKRLLGLLEEAGRTADFSRLLTKVVQSNKNKRFDLVVSIAAERVFVHVENKDWEKAHKTYLGALRKLATKAGGHLFYQLVQPYVQSCLEEGKLELAEEALRRSRRSFEAKKGSILDKDLEELGDLVKAKAG